MTKEIVDFILQHKLYDRSELTRAINRHVEFETITTLKDDKGILAVMRFNVNGECVHILELLVRPDMEKNHVIKWITAKTWHKFPYLRYFKFNRAYKYPNRPQRAYKITKLLKG